MVTLLFMMIVGHVVGDYILQTDFLAKFKCKESWREYITDNPRYKHDYIVILFVHAFIWTVCVFAPIIYMVEKDLLFEPGTSHLFYRKFALIAAFVANWTIHAFVDHQKANLKNINLIQDQTAHIVQIWLTWILTIGLILL